jgi:hypothetical protein
MPGYPGDPAAAVALHAGHGDARAQVGAGPLRGGREDRVQHVAPGRHDEVDPGLVLDRAGHRPAAGIEGDLPDGRSATGQDRGEQPPAAELDNAAAGDRMGRDRVAGE